MTKIQKYILYVMIKNAYNYSTDSIQYLCQLKPYSDFSSDESKAIHLTFKQASKMKNSLNKVAVNSLSRYGIEAVSD